MKLSLLHEGQMDRRQFLAATAAIGTGMLGGRLPAAQPATQQTAYSTGDPGLDAELPTIISAARRNNCTGPLFYILLAVRKAEGGGAGKQFGVLSQKAATLDRQAGVAAATIVKNYQRWEAAGKLGNFIDYLGNVYAPTKGATNDPKGLNKNWANNVKRYFEQYRHAGIPLDQLGLVG